MRELSHPEKTNATEITAGLIIVGDEILKGQVRDVNTSYVARKLHDYGIRLQRVSVIHDDVATIAGEVRGFSNSFSLVITAGGVGSTHDDVTLEGVAKAFDDHLELNQDVAEIVRHWFRTSDPDDPAFKLARIPSRSQLNFGVDGKAGQQLRLPIISLENVYVFPGIPEVLQLAFDNLGPTLFGSLTRRQFHVQDFFSAEYETSIVDRLNQLVADYPSASFGSYPTWTHNYYKTKLTVETGSEELLREIGQKLTSSIPTMAFDDCPREDTLRKLQELQAHSGDQTFSTNVDEAIKTIEKCLQDYKAEEIIICFNGGKDCIVMLHLTFALFRNKFPNKKLQALYIRERQPFPEVEAFVRQTVSDYGLEALNYDGDMKAALEQMLAERPHIKAALMGTRRGDPGSHYQDFFSPTDGNWPRLMRVNPILNWEYSHVWKFIRGLSLPYPQLYDEGYTSLGCAKSTKKNDTLRYVDADGVVHYRPAHELENVQSERAGRR